MISWMSLSDSLGWTVSTRIRRSKKTGAKYESDGHSWFNSRSRGRSIWQHMPTHEKLLGFWLRLFFSESCLSTTDYLSGRKSRSLKSCLIESYRLGADWGDMFGHLHFRTMLFQLVHASLFIGEGEDMYIYISFDHWPEVLVLIFSKIQCPSRCKIRLRSRFF